MDYLQASPLILVILVLMAWGSWRYYVVLRRLYYRAARWPFYLWVCLPLLVIAWWGWESTRWQREPAYRELFQEMTDTPLPANTTFVVRTASSDDRGGWEEMRVRVADSSFRRICDHIKTASNWTKTTEPAMWRGTPLDGDWQPLTTPFRYAARHEGGAIIVFESDGRTIQLGRGWMWR